MAELEAKHGRLLARNQSLEQGLRRARELQDENKLLRDAARKTPLLSLAPAQSPSAATLGPADADDDKPAATNLKDGLAAALQLLGLAAQYCAQEPPALWTALAAVRAAPLLVVAWQAHGARGRRVAGPATDGALKLTLLLLRTLHAGRTASTAVVSVRRLGALALEALEGSREGAPAAAVLAAMAVLLSHPAADVAASVTSTLIALLAAPQHRTVFLAHDGRRAKEADGAGEAWIFMSFSRYPQARRLKKT